MTRSSILIACAALLLSSAGLAVAENDPLPRDYEGNLQGYPAEQSDIRHSRAGRVELFGLAEWTGGDHAAHQDNSAMDIAVEPGYGGGFGFGQNITPYFNFNLSFSGGGPDIKGAFGATEVNVYENTQYVRGDFNVDYYPLPGPITPLITAGVGFFHFAGTDPVDDRKHSETDFSGNVGAGLRWDIGNHLFLKGVYQWTWTEMEYGDSPMQFESIRLILGWTF